MTEREAALRKLLGRYLDNHCANADAEGMSVLCECQLCLDARAALAPPSDAAALAEPECTCGCDSSSSARYSNGHLSWCAKRQNKKVENG